MKLNKHGPAEGRRKLRVRETRGFWQRFLGLMLTRPPGMDQALLITPCNGVHTCFMRYPIDVVYMDAGGKVVKLVSGLVPWRFSFGGKDAVQALEFVVGGMEHHGIRAGSRLEFTGADGCGWRDLHHVGGKV